MLPDESTRMICPNCHLGRIELKYVTFLSIYGGTLISAPNTPAWECNVCHERHIAPDAIQRIEALIGPGGPPPNKYQPARRYKLVTPPEDLPKTDKK
ncbi:MAG TPA: YgiT-type zinc finger protein [Aggregatilineales bacterium]|nr:YgiT-type zinc finger protein [Aggregatilineales bacterium]